MGQNSLLDLHLILERCGTHPPNILHTLLAVQEVLGYVPPATVPDIAHSLEVTEADVAGVLAFYPHLRTRPSGRHVVRICLGESRVANRGGRTLTELRDHLKIDLGETTPDGRFTLERVYCLGNCAVAPTVMVDDDLHGRAVGAQVISILKSYG